jgi:hypothetical protein
VSDPRGFKYELQAVLQRAQWELEAAQSALAAALGRQRDNQASLEQLQREQHAVQKGAAAAGQRFDPLHARAIVDHLCHLAVKLRQQSERCDVLVNECALRRRDCAEAQARHESLEAHRDRALAAHDQAVLRKEAALADEQWIAHITSKGLPMASEIT